MSSRLTTWLATSSTTVVLSKRHNSQQNLQSDNARWRTSCQNIYQLFSSFCKTNKSNKSKRDCGISPLSHWSSSLRGLPQNLHCKSQPPRFHILYQVCLIHWVHYSNTLNSSLVSPGSLFSQGVQVSLISQFSQNIHIPSMLAVPFKLIVKKTWI